MRVFYALQVKDIGFCCCEMKDAYRQGVITFGGEGEYINGAPRLALGIKAWCGRKIELIRAPFDVAKGKKGVRCW